MMWALGLLGAVRKGLAALWALAVKYPALAALVAALCLSAWLWRGWNHADARADKWHTAWTAMDNANKKATKWAKAEAARKDKIAETAKDNANASLKPSLAAGQAATDRYVAANRCVRVTPAKGGGQRADLPGSDTVARQPQGDGGQADVAVTERDLAVCTSNTLRLDNAVNVWAADMVARGLAR